MIEFFSEETSYSLENQANIEKWILKCVETESYELGDISVIFCSDAYLQKINIEYLSKDYFTDIITFDYTEDNIISGDLFISIDTVKDNAEDNHVSFTDELERVIIHGILHLLGYKDKTDEDSVIMRKMEDKMFNIRY